MRDSMSKLPTQRFHININCTTPLMSRLLSKLCYTSLRTPPMPSDVSALHLYSRKILIKSDCRELLPPYMRFMKGIVDCEDLPLNISRETYQDTALVSRLRSVVTRRAIKMLEDEAKSDPVKYNRWYEKF
jgi:TNF receptor-associated protein 1